VYTESDLDAQRQRAARSQSMFRRANERIDQLNSEFGNADETRRYVCECANTSCGELILVPHDEYLRIRRHPNEFLVAPGHELPHVEEVVERTARWIVVRKLGLGAAVAEELAAAS